MAYPPSVNDPPSPATEQRSTTAGDVTSSPGLETARGSADRLLQRKLQRRAVQRAASRDGEEAAIRAAGEAGTSGAGSPLPHAESIQRSFGRHDVSGIQAHVGAEASQAARAMGAEGFASGNHVAFDGAPGLHTAAHEAAHVFQQRAGVHLKGGVGEEGDTYERHADAVADRVVRGESAESLLDQLAPGRGSGGGSVQRASRGAVQRVVLTKKYPLMKGGTLTKYYSTYDTKTEFDDADSAWKHDAKLKQQQNRSFKSDERVPTNFSYYNTDSRNAMTNSKQGPHTLSHSSTAFRLNKRMKDTGLVELRDQQVPKIGEFKQMLEKEKPSTLKDEQKERMIGDYETLYGKLDELLKAEKADTNLVHELIMRLMQMNPYSAYGKGKKTGRGHIKGKGEREDDAFDDAFDKGAKFNDMDGYKAFKEMREKLWSDDDVEKGEKGDLKEKEKEKEKSDKVRLRDDEEEDDEEVGRESKKAKLEEKNEQKN